MDMQKKRKMLEVLRGLIGSGFDGGQKEICEYLSQKGFEVNQSTVSRALKKIGASKVADQSGSRYELLSAPTEVAFGPTLGRSLANLLYSIESNESLIVLKTKPGSAMFLAGFIDHYCKKEILGTVAGDDTVFVAPKTVSGIEQHKERVKEFIEEYH